MTTEAYKTLYQSSNCYAMKKQLQAEAGVGEMATTVTKLSANKLRLENMVNEKNKKLEEILAKQKEKKD